MNFLFSFYLISFSSFLWTVNAISLSLSLSLFHFVLVSIFTFQSLCGYYYYCCWLQGSSLRHHLLFILIPRYRFHCSSVVISLGLLLIWSLAKWEQYFLFTLGFFLFTCNYLFPVLFTFLFLFIYLYPRPFFSFFFALTWTLNCSTIFIFP